MSGVCIDKLPHHCGTKKGLQVFANSETGKVDGFCFSCGSYVANPYGEPVDIGEIKLPQPKSQEEIKRELAEVDGYPVVDLPSRKLRAEDLSYFGFRVAMDESDGKTPAAYYMPVTRDGKLSGYYVKTVTKPAAQWSIGDVKGGEPIGWQAAKRSGAYKLIITEGPEDAVAVRSIFRRFNDKEEYMPAIISLTNGVNSVNKCLNPVADDVKRLFREVVFCFDNDKQGNKAVEDGMLIFPQAKCVILPEKDANDCLLRGAQKAAYKALAFQATTPKNTRLIAADDALHGSAREPTPYGELTWPFPTMNKLLRNIRLGETIYLAAGVKMGKSEMVDTLGAHFIKNDGVKILMAKPEQANKDSYKRLCSKVAETIFHDPEVEFDYKAFDEAGEVVKGNAFFLNLYQHLGWETLRKDIVAAASQGVKVVFIDPITNLTAGMQAGEANAELTGITRDISALAKDLNIVVFIFCHLKAHDGNISPEVRAKKYKNGQYYRLGSCPHERGGDVLSSQFHGSRAMMQSCDLMLGLEGNKDDELPKEIRNMRYLTILEDRQFGNSATVPLYYNTNTGVYKEA